MTDRTIVLPLALLEGAHLAGLLDEFTGLLAAPDVDADSGIQRLTPNAYPDDENASAEFAEATKQDLLDRRLQDASVVRGALGPFFADSADELSEDEALAPRDVLIPDGELDAWLRTLTALRLVIASRLGIASDDREHDPEDPRFGVYDWLGYRLEVLIEIADNDL